MCVYICKHSCSNIWMQFDCNCFYLFTYLVFHSFDLFTKVAFILSKKEIKTNIVKYCNYTTHTHIYIICIFFWNGTAPLFQYCVMNKMYYINIYSHQLKLKWLSKLLHFNEDFKNWKHKMMCIKKINRVNCDFLLILKEWETIASWPTPTSASEHISAFALYACFWVEKEEEDRERNVKCRVITDGSDDRPLYLSFSLSLMKL